MRNNMSFTAPGWELNIPEPSGPAEGEQPAAPEPAADPGQPAGGTDPAATDPSSTPSPSDPSKPPVADEKFEIKVDGKTEMLTRAETIARAQQGSDYTRKTQQLADDKRHWEAQKRLEQDKDRQAKEAHDAEAKRLTDSEKDPVTIATERVQALEDRLEDQQLDVSIKSILAKHEGVSEKEFLSECTLNGLRSAKDVAERGDALAAEILKSHGERFDSRFNEIVTKGEHPSLKAMKDKWLAEYLQSKKGGPTPPIGKGAPTPSTNTDPKKIRTLDDAADEAERLLKEASMA